MAISSSALSNPSRWSEARLMMVSDGHTNSRVVPFSQLTLVSKQADLKNGLIVLEFRQGWERCPEKSAKTSLPSSFLNLYRL